MIDVLGAYAFEIGIAAKLERDRETPPIDFDRLSALQRNQQLGYGDLREFIEDPASGCLYSGLKQEFGSEDSRRARFKRATEMRAMRREMALERPR